ncbi:hypothetical protein QUB00_20625 [Microcoleus sp. F8_C2]
MGFTLQAGVKTGQSQANCLWIQAFECDRTWSALVNYGLSGIIQTTQPCSDIPHFSRKVHKKIDIRSQQQSGTHKNLVSTPNLRCERSALTYKRGFSLRLHPPQELKHPESLSLKQEVKNL